MEQIKELTQQVISELHQNSLWLQSQADSHAPTTINRNENGEISISTYTDQLATKDEIAIGMAKLCVAFPKMEQGFWSILAERILANNFTKERIKQAVENILDNFHYKELTIADIIKFDKRVKLYTYNDVYRMMQQFPHPDFECREINGVRYYVRKVDLLNA